MLNQKNYFSNFVRHAKGGVIQCTSAGGGSCTKSIGVGFVGGAAVGGGAGAWGSGALASMSGGFAGGVTGSALNGGEGWDVLKGGLMGSGMALASYAMVWGYNNHIRPGDLSNKDNVKFAEKNDDSVPTKEAGSFKGDEYEKLAAEDFKKWHASAEWKNGEGESGVSYRRNTSFWTGEKYVTRVPDTQKHIEGTIIKLNANADYIFHSHPNHAYPSIADYSSAQYSYNTYGG